MRETDVRFLAVVYSFLAPKLSGIFTLILLEMPVFLDDLSFFERRLFLAETIFGK